MIVSFHSGQRDARTWMWLDPTRYRPRNAHATRNGATYLEDRARFQWRMDEWAYRGWQLHGQENHLERSLQMKNIIFRIEVRWKTSRIIPESISKVWHASGLENADKKLPQYFTLRCSLFHCVATHKAFSARRTITFGTDGCETCFSATSTTNSRYPRVSRIRLEIEFSDLARNVCMVFTRSFCRSAKAVDTRCAACGTRWGSSLAF